MCTNGVPGHLLVVPRGFCIGSVAGSCNICTAATKYVFVYGYIHTHTHVYIYTVYTVYKGVYWQESNNTICITIQHNKYFIFYILYFRHDDIFYQKSLGECFMIFKWEVSIIYQASAGHWWYCTE